MTTPRYTSSEDLSSPPARGLSKGASTSGAQKQKGANESESTPLSMGTPRFSTPEGVAATAAAKLARSQQTSTQRNVDAVAASIKTRDLLRAKANRFKK